MEVFPDETVLADSAIVDWRSVQTVERDYLVRVAVQSRKSAFPPARQRVNACLVGLEYPSRMCVIREINP